MEGQELQANFRGHGVAPRDISRAHFREQNLCKSARSPGLPEEEEGLVIGNSWMAAKTRGDSIQYPR